MCMVSSIGDNWKDQFPEKHPGFNQPPLFFPVGVSQAEFDALKAEMKELKKLLKAAKAFDQATGQPDCEMADKVKLIKEIAKIVGVDLGDVFGKEPKK